MPLSELAPQVLYRSCDPQDVPFATTDEAGALDEVVGQPRAVAAVELGLTMASPGYNLFALGPPGIGKSFLIKRFVERQAEHDPVPDDWCYLYDFAEQHRPKALALPAGKGGELRRDMADLVEQLRPALIAAFEREDYQTRRRMIDQEHEERQDKMLEDLGREARERGLGVVRTPLGLIFAPVKDGEVLAPDELDKVPEEERERLGQEMDRLKEEFEKVSSQVPRWQRERMERVRQLDREVTRYAVGSLIDELQAKYAGFPALVSHLDAVEQDIVRRVRDLLAKDDGDDAEPAGGARDHPARDHSARDHPAFRRYQVNLLVDRGGQTHAPVVYEDNPTYQNLAGRLEHLSHMGTLVTDFTLIKPGAFHRANGGYLVLDARRVLTQPFAWEGLKRTLEAGCVKIESLAQAWSLISTVSLEPEAIPLKVKVVLMGDRLLYYLLTALDPDFPELFKVAVDLEESLDRADGLPEVYARLIAGLVKKEKLRPFDRGAVARVIEHGARTLGDAHKLSLHTSQLVDLLRESDHVCGDGRPVVAREDVERAIAGQIFRADRIRQHLQEQIRRGTIRVETQGAVTGQVNGLAVFQLGGFAFGNPGRITARVRLGEGEVVDIEREVELGGPLHSKGVLILSGFLGERYAADQPLSLQASLVFEQTYGGVEGDSASMAELCALISAISGVPIRQSLAITGSVDQRGLAQAIGGVNEKIEGFFDTCKARGLTGEQGVLIPASNAQHLMLRAEVVDAVREGTFHVWTIADVDDALAALTGLPAGERDAAGAYPEGSVNRKVADRLAFFAERRKSFLKGPKEET